MAGVVVTCRDFVEVRQNGFVIEENFVVRSYAAGIVKNTVAAKNDYGIPVIKRSLM